MTSDKMIVDAEGADSVAVADVFPDFAISLQEANRRVRLLHEFVREHMVEGEDYGVIPGTTAKPTLFKPGAEKLNAIFGLAPVVDVTNRVEDWDNGFLHYEVKVTLVNKRTSQVEAEGIGSCNSRERKYKNQDASNLANTILKMAKKRALVDATLSATRASGLFTQDLEDLDGDRPEVEATQRAAAPARHAEPERKPQSAPAKYEFVPAATIARPAVTGNTLTEAQRGAILSMSNKAFGATAQEELAKFVDKPVAELTKSEASAVLDRLRALLIEQQLPRDTRQTGAGTREVAASR